MSLIDHSMHGRLNASHFTALAVFALGSCMMSFPLVLHFDSAIPGLPGDNYGYLWNLWWSRFAFDTGTHFWHSAHLLFPDGVDLVNHPHTYLQGLVSATVLRSLTVIEAETLYILGTLFLNAAAAYALAFDITGRSRASMLAALYIRMVAVRDVAIVRALRPAGHLVSP